MEPLKNIYNAAFFGQLCSGIEASIPSFDKKAFLKQIYADNWEQKELKQRMRHIAVTLHSWLPGKFTSQLKLLLSIIRSIRRSSGSINSLAYMLFPDFIELYGIDYPDQSLKAMEEITGFASCEFAVRPFILRYPDQVAAQMLQWTDHPDHHVRRFASEGIRPRLPWAIAIPALKKDPSPIIPILEKLKNDSSEYVRKSVANNLNDIAKDNPQVVIGLARKWKGISKETDWVIKHGCRTLLKKADASIYTIFDLRQETNASISKLKLDKTKLRIGDDLNFSFDLINSADTATKLRVEFAVYYIKSNGNQSRKLFKISENNYEAKSTYAFRKKLSFKDLTTRIHYAGKHRLAIVVNGREMGGKDFLLQL